jgi:TonB-linked SusC/RagA family outer membrane protein
MSKKILVSVCAFLMTIMVGFSQTVTVTGKVIDEKNAPVAGASVLDKGSKKGVSAGTDGTFSISVKKGSTLVVSALGYESKEVAALNNVTVQLVSDVKALADVVVTGVGAATSKKKLGVAVESVNLANQVKVSTGDVGQQLVGQVAGAQISSTNGTPGRPLQILLRGINTVQGGTSPMILIDGIEARATSLNSIDVNIIERVEVVQGAAAASLYGAQGANGVIQLFTKKGKQGRVNIEVSSSTTSNELLNIGGLAKAKYHAFVTDAANNVVIVGGKPMTLDPATLVYNGDVQYNSLGVLGVSGGTYTSIQNKPYDANLKYYDHYKMFLQPGYATNNSVTISGAGPKVDYLFSASNNKQNSNFINNGDFQRSNLTSKIGVELAKGLKFTTTTQLVYTKNTMLDQTGRGIFFNINNARPFANFMQKDLDGNYGPFFGAAVGVNHTNPLYQTQYSSSLIEKVDVIQNFNLNYRLPKFLELDAKYALNYSNNNVTYRYEDQSMNAGAVLQSRYVSNYNPNASPTTTGEIDNYVQRTTFQNFIGTATFRTDFQKDFNINIPLKTSTTVAFDYRKSKYKQFAAYGYDAPGYYPWNASQAGTYKVISDYVEPFVTYGILANQRFDWSDWAGFSVGVRSDYSSAFGSGATAQTFPRGDAFLAVHKLKQFEELHIDNIVNEFKLRAGYGEAGIQPGAFQRFPVLNATNLGSNSVFVSPITTPNTNLSVELSKETEYGADLGLNLLGGKWLRTANVSATLWKRETVNAIYSVDAPPSAGVGGTLDNAFGLGSHGLQASLNLNVFSGKDLTWDFITNYSQQTSEITYVKGPPVVITSGAGSVGITLKQGYKIGQFFGYRMMKSLDEINPLTGQRMIPVDQTNNYEVVHTKVGGDWVVNKTTKQAVALPGQYSLGDPNPKFNMSFINNLNYKGWLTFNMQWDWVAGAHLYNQTKQWMYRDGIHHDYDNPVLIAGQNFAYTAFYRSMYAGGAANGTKNYFYEDASFVRLRNISFGVDLNKFAKLKAFTRLQLVLSGRNLVTFTPYTGMDPEANYSTNSAFDRGLDHNTIPNTKQYTIGLNVGF